MMTFNDVKGEIEKCGIDADILLGNGFSMGIFPEYFDYSSLLEEVFKKIDEEFLKDLLSKNKDSNSNLEYYLKLMADSMQCIPFLTDTKYLELKHFDKEKLEKDRVILKSKILETIKSIHPANFRGKEVEIGNCSDNLNIFHRIYTLNYDLILYWVFLTANLSPLNKNKFKDGMWKKVENGKLHLFGEFNSKFNIHYLHGALHLLMNDQGDTFKIINNSEGKTLKNVISKLQKRKILGSYDNLMVLEGSEIEKLKIISNNAYLHKSLQRLASINGILVIYGCSILNEAENGLNNDTHIWRRIVNSNYTSLYIGLHVNSESKLNSLKQIILKEFEILCESSFEPTRIYFFTTTEGSIWLN